MQRACSYLFSAVRINMFYPHYIENWIVIVNFDGKGVFGIPVTVITI